ncbi:hypothetical protein [Streptacidiphilus carbonis]|jgi:hypothetical protein|uniref:hypothetical protein n=1 Tax=Streptacidiphilus carbonis TaxID=105422 RepID=UPI0005AAA6DE|nr:hypothetical protein [Streptacidiphilus carbonis]
MPIRRATLASALAGTALVGALIGAGTPASAAAQPPAQREAKAVCTRAPQVDARITRALARLHGPASERGSIARLQKRVGVAKAAGDTAIETYLNNRLTARQNMVGTLTTRQSDLKQVETWCTANHLGGAK